MGWPKKNDGARLYYERKGKSYLLVFPDLKTPDGAMEYVGEVMIDNNPERPMLASGSCSGLYLYHKCNRVQWSDMPEVWQQSLGEWLTDSPRDLRGLWKMEMQGVVC